MRPLLSICVPTFNRPKEFKRLLENLIPQLNDQIEIVVRDDSTNQYSLEIFESLTSQAKFKVQYFKGEKIGVDSANLFLLEKALGKYIWWFSDDDILLENGVQTALNIFNSDPEINFIWANFAYQEITNIVLEREHGYFKNGSDVIRSLGVNIGLMSTYILKTDIGRQGLIYARKHVNGFSFAATAVVLWVLTQPGKFFFLKGPYIICNPTTIEEFKKIMVKSDGSIDNPAFNIYGVYFYLMVDGISNQFEYDAVRRLLSLNFSSLWRGILVGWVGGWDSPNGKRWRMLKIYWNYPECWIAITLFCFPLPIVRSIYRIYKIFFNERKFIFRRKI